MKAEQAISFLRDHPIFWSRMGFCYDPPMLDGEGKPILVEDDFDFFRAAHESFSDIGVRVHTCILHTGWVGVDRYDYSLCDRVLNELFQSGKTDYFVPRIKLNVPVDWCRQNPDEVCVYYDGPRSAEQIRALVGTEQQDYLGFDSETGYSSGKWKDPRPNVGGVISMQSFSSQKWKQDAGEALRRLVQHLESGPYADRILAYHIAYGACGESMPWGRYSNRFGDYGISNQKHFLEWGIQKYGSEEALEKAWGAISNGDIVPPPEKREWTPNDAEHSYRFESETRRGIDYDRFTTDVNVDALSHFGKIAKENSGGKAVGCFYGYLLHMRRSAYAGHLGWEKAFQSPYLDFFAAPKSYYRCQAGEAGGEMAPTVSVNLRKLWVDECDNRTHLAIGDTHHVAENLEQTQTVHLRELCKNISHNSGLWYMDLGGGWYAQKEIMEHLEVLIKRSLSIRKRPYKSIAEVFWAADEEGILHGLPDRIKANEDTMRNFQLAGAPIDFVFAKDLLKLDTSRARLVILQDPISCTDDFLQALKKKLPQNCHICWFGKSGVSNGFELINTNLSPKPYFAIKESHDQIALAYDENGAIIAAQGKNGDFTVSAFPIGVEAARRMLELAGVHCLAPMECAVYADNRMVSFFPRVDLRLELEIPQNCKLIDMQTGIAYAEKTELRILAKSGRAFAIEEFIPN